MDRIRPGGIYKVGGVLVNAEGEKVENDVALPPSDDLPADFPSRDALIGAGFDSLAKVRAASDGDLDKVPGIGPATLKEIRSAQG